MNLIHFSAQRVLFNGKNELYSFCMAPPKPSDAQILKSTAILRAARVHFAKHGFEATKLSEVARDAGVAVGTIYLRYAGKSELLGGVLEDVEQSFCAAMDTSAIWDAPFPQRFADIVSAVLATAAKADDLAALMALAAFAPDYHGQAMLRQIEAHILDGVAQGAMRDDVDPAIAARMAHGMVEGAMRELMANPARLSSEVVAAVSDAYSRWLLRD